MIIFREGLDGHYEAEQIKVHIPEVGASNIDYNWLIRKPGECLMPHNIYNDIYFNSDISRDVIVSTTDILKNNVTMINIFLASRRLEGCSKGTINGYATHLRNFLFGCLKPFHEVNTLDCRAYLAKYKENRFISNNTLDDVRRVLNTFFLFLEEEEFILRSPMRKVHKIKGEKTVRKPFTEEEIEMIRDVCETSRDLALVDFLNSSGVRANELITLNRTDIDMSTKEGIVYGKGAKERIIYFDAKTKIHLVKYLKKRTDKCPALFVTDHKPKTRLTVSGLEHIIAHLGVLSGVENCYPHRFRRTLATRLIKKNVPIEQVQRILGHSKIETTLIYAEVSQLDVKMNHEKFSS